MDEQLPMEHFNPKCCNVFNFTPSDGVAPFLGLPGGGREGERDAGWWGGSCEGMAGEGKGGSVELAENKTYLRKEIKSRDRLNK